MAEPSQPKQITIELDWNNEPPTTYANGAQILNTQREFAIVFTDFAGFPGRGGVSPEQTPKAKIVASIRLTPDVFFQLSAAMASNWNNFVNMFGDPTQPNPKFKLIGGGPMQLEGIEPPRRDG